METGKDMWKTSEGKSRWIKMPSDGYVVATTTLGSDDNTSGSLM